MAAIPHAVPPPPEFLNYALRYAAHGWRVFPCHPGQKAPITKHGFKDASGDPDQIREWWTRTPEANIGIPCEHWFILDIDPRSGGHLSLEDLEEANGRLPDTLSQITGGGGRHYLLPALPPGAPPKNSSSKVAPGIDVKSVDGYVLVAPSVTAKQYLWDGGAEFEQQTVAQAPAWLLSLMARTQSVPNAPTDAPARITDGKRHATLLAYAGKIRRSGLGYKEILAALTVMNNDRCDPPAPSTHIERLCESICKYKPDEVADRYLKRIAAELAVIQFPSRPGSSPSSIPAAVDDWQSKLSKNLKDEAKKLLCNSVAVFRYCRDWHGAFRFNEFSLNVEAARDLLGGAIHAGEVISDYHVALITDHLQHELLIENPESVNNVAIDTVARSNGYHPVRDYLNGLTWDGMPRVEGWLTEYLGVQQSNYACAVGRNWLVSAVARVMQPGCKADAAIIFEGLEGLGKSSAMKIMGDPWFSDDIADIGDKDACMQMRGKWIIEIAELDAMGKAEVTRVRAFLSRQVDNYRPPYGRKTMDVPRQCIFGGSRTRAPICRTTITDASGRSPATRCSVACSTSTGSTRSRTSSGPRLTRCSRTGATGICRRTLRATPRSSRTTGASATRGRTQ